jgi:prevent-host-death family protein
MLLRDDSGGPDPVQFARIGYHAALASSEIGYYLLVAGVLLVIVPEAVLDLMSEWEELHAYKPPIRYKKGAPRLAEGALPPNEVHVVEASARPPCQVNLSLALWRTLDLYLYRLYESYIMTRLNVSKARDEFPDVVNRAAYAKERTIVSRRGKDLAAVIPIDDLRLLERLAQEEIDRLDLEDARAALKEAKEKGTTPLRDLMRELGD